jgi:transposase-like protein
MLATDQRAEAVALRSAGYRIKEVARELDIGFHTARRLTRNVERGPRYLPPVKTCPGCGARFTPPAGYREDVWAKRVMCSRACGSKFAWSIVKGRR